MKHLILLALLSGLLFFSCKKDNTTPAQTKNTKLGSAFKVETSSVASYTVQISEYDGNTEVLGIDTTINKSSFNYQFQPHIGNQLTFSVYYISPTGQTPAPLFKAYYGGIEQTNYQNTTLTINPPYSFISVLTFVVK